MAKYRVLEKSFINNALVDEGAIIDYDGEASANLELIEDVSDPAETPAPKQKAKAAKAAAGDENPA